VKDVEIALIVRDAESKRLGVQGSSERPLTAHQKIAPGFHRACASLLALYKQADRVEAVSWHAGLDLEHAPILVRASRTNKPGQVAYQVLAQQDQGQQQKGEGSADGKD
jgi:hypothetical protein